MFIDRSRDPADSIVVAGTARSGTSWLASTLAATMGARTVFEPFNTGTVAEARSFGEFPYRDRDDDDEALTGYCRKILSGELRGPGVDRDVRSLFPRGRVVKLVRANLLLAWLRRTFPSLPIVLLLRHPCAVASSRKECGWSPEKDFDALRARRRLLEDQLGDVLDVIESARTAAAKRAVIWCVHYRTPMRQLRPGEVVAAWYEHLCRAPEQELRRLVSRLGMEWTPGVLRWAARPSETARLTSSVLTGEDKVQRWKTVMTPAEIDDVLTVVRAFRMDHLYDESLMPLDTSFAPWEGA